jgi:intracellular sulfur oxidation DsrE/DsrF family protein
MKSNFVIFHLAEPGRFGVILDEIRNLFAEPGIGSVIVEVMANSDGVYAVRKNGPHMEEAGRLSGEGVRFTACANSMRIRHLSREEIMPFVEPVPSGVGELVRRQREGYAYIRT